MAVFRPLSPQWKPGCFLWGSSYVGDTSLPPTFPKRRAVFDAQPSDTGAHKETPVCTGKSQEERKGIHYKRKSAAKEHPRLLDLPTQGPKPERFPQGRRLLRV